MGLSQKNDQQDSIQKNINVEAVGFKQNIKIVQ